MRFLLPVLLIFACPLAALDDPPDNLDAIGDKADGKRDGTWTFLDSKRNKLFQIDYHRGERSGAYMRWNADGKLLILGEYFDDKRHGAWREFYENGELQSEGSYFAGVRHGDWKSFHDNGRIAEEGTFQVGKRDDYWTGHHPDGTTSYTGTYEKDVKNGEWSYYHPGGQLIEQGVFVDDERDGRWRQWNEAGEVVSDFLYENGGIAAVSAQPGRVSNAKLKEYHFVVAESRGPLRGTPKELDGRELGQMTVRITRTGLPQVVVLSSVEPVEWTLDVASGVEIDRVVVAGKYRQLLKDVPGGVRVDSEFEVDGSVANLFHLDDRDSRGMGDAKSGLSKRVETYLESELTTHQLSHRGSAQALIGRVADRVVTPPEDAELHIVCVYEGTTEKPAGFREHPMGDVTVKVIRTGVPLVLYLGSYEPVRWNVEVGEGVSIHSIIVGGYHDQLVSGAPEEAQVRNLNNEGQRGFYAYSKEKPEYQRMVVGLRDMTGLELVSFSGKYRGEEFEISKGVQPASPPPIDAVMHIVCAETGVPVPGKEDERAITVKVGLKEREIVLVLGAEKPVTWNLQIDKGVVVERIILIGEADARLRGLPPGCPVLRHTRPAVGDDRIQGVTSTDAPEAQGMKLKLKDLTGLDTASLQAKETAENFELD